MNFNTNTLVRKHVFQRRMEKRNGEVKWLCLEGCVITDVSAIEQVAGPEQELVSEVALDLIIMNRQTHYIH